MTDPTAAISQKPDGEQTSPDTSALDAPQQFGGASSFQVRDKLQKLVERDLLGPWDGEAEQFTPRAMGPRERYLVGMLGPKHQPKSTLHDADTISDTESGVHGETRGDEAGELPEVLTPQNLGRIWASSMGLSFCVGADTDVLSVTASWGQYSRQETEDDEGRKRTAWAREPRAFPLEVRLDGASDQRIPLTASDLRDPCVSLAVAVRSHGTTKRTVELTLINNQQEPPSHADTAWLFQAKLTVSALDGAAAVFLSIDDPLEDVDPALEDPEELHLRLLYRNQLKFANGHNVAVHADAEPPIRRARTLETTWLPSYNVPATIAPVGDGTPLAGAMLSMDALAGADLDRLRAGLSPLAGGYTTWLDQRAAEITALPEPLRPAAEAAVFRARRAADRIRAGLILLTDPDAAGHADALRAFQFANSNGRPAAAHRDRPAARGPVRQLPRRQGQSGRRRCESRVVAALPARVRAAQPALAHRPRASRTGGTPRRHRRPAVLSHRWRQDRGLSGADRVHLRDPPPAGHGRQRRAGAQRRRRRRGADALHPAAAHRPAVPAGRRAGLRRRGHPPRRRGDLGQRAVPHRPVGRQQRLPELVQGRRGADR